MNLRSNTFLIIWSSTNWMDLNSLKSLLNAKGYITTAGFESICEALLLGKLVLMVPVAGQYEQACNAIEAVGAGAGISDDHFNIERFLIYVNDFKSQKKAFRDWMETGSNIILNAVTNF